LENKKDFNKKTENKMGIYLEDKREIPIFEAYLDDTFARNSKLILIYLEVCSLIRIFAASNISFDYPGRIPRGVRLYRYCPF